MANKYLVWNDAACGGKNVEWIEMNGRDFFRFLNSSESSGRRFIMLGSDICPEADVIFIEATEAQYKDWYTDYCHHCYVKKAVPEAGPLSLDMSFGDEEIASLHEIIADVTVHVESAAIQAALINILPYAISTLNQNRREAVTLKYFKYCGKADWEIAEILGIEEKAFVKRKNRALDDLRKFFKK